MTTERRACQNCKSDFVIEPADFDFYGKMAVPPPTFCPDCRLQRRLIWRHERALYKRKCDLCSKLVISVYHADQPFPVYCLPCWWSDKWDPLDYGKDYDFSKSFFSQFQELQNEVPHPGTSAGYTTLTNSEYVNMARELKNCYLVYNTDFSENITYGSEVENSKDCMDATMLESCELCYECLNCTKCFRTFFSKDCEGCSEVWFSDNCSNCQDCFGCVNLRNKKYHIWNEPYSKEDYEAKVNELVKSLTPESVRQIKDKVRGIYLKEPHRYMHGTHNANVSGDYVYHAKDTHHSFITRETQNCKYCMWLIIKPNKDCYDYTQFGKATQNVYEALVCGVGVNDVKFSLFCVSDVRDLQYCEECKGSAGLFGCIALRKKKNCILNKQYSEEEYRELLPKVIQHMDEMPYTDGKGRVHKYGEFFPSELSPLAYNESTAIQYFPLDENGARGAGYKWHQEEKKEYEVTMQTGDIPKNAKDAGDDIVHEVIGCEHKGECNEQCATAFKIIPKELEFYRQMGLPLPRLCPNCRHYSRLANRNPNKLNHRQCMCDYEAYSNSVKHEHHPEGRCPNEFETTYAPDRPEIVYCEQCYQAEVV